MTEVELYEITAANLEVAAAFMSNYATHSKGMKNHPIS